MNRSRRARAALLTAGPAVALVAALAAAPLTTASAAPAGDRWRIAITHHEDRSSVGVAVAADAPDDVWSAGLLRYDAEEGWGTPVVQRWNGHGWRVFTLAGLSTQSQISGLAARAPDDVWVDGVDDATGHPFVQHFDGRRWTAVTTAGMTPFRGGLAVTTNRAWALGTFHSVAVYHNGAWTRSRAIETGYLEDVAARTKNDVWTVGTTRDATATSGPYNPIAAHWNGARWTRTPLPVDHCVLYAVTIGGPDDAWTVCTPVNGAATTILHWNGHAWHAIPSPVGTPDDFRSLAASPAGDLWGVANRSQVLHWNGNAWTAHVLPAPQPRDQIATTRGFDVAYLPGTGTGVYATGSAAFKSEGDDIPTEYVTWRTR